jgi:LytS/YehU family sensor histidine kinase
MSTKDTITLDEEINSLKLYLELEKMRFEDSFNYTIQQATSLNKDMIRIPSMLVQPYVENAIKHGLLHKKTNRLLKINFDQLDNHIIINIDDNGIGRKRSQELNQIKNRRHESFAMNANKKRLDILKNTYSDINFDIIDKMSPLGEPLGTKVIIKLPIKSY